MIYLKVNQLIATVITTLLPAKRWSQAAFTMSGLLAYYYRLFKGHKVYKYNYTVGISRAHKLNHLLALMTRLGKPFPITICAQGSELFLKPRPKGLILCSTHIPLSKVAIRHLMEHGFTPTVVLATNPDVIDSIAIWGRTETIPAIRTGPFVLQKAKSVLQQGGSIVVLVDRELGGPYSPNVFRLAEKINADIIFFDAILQRQGVVNVRFHESEWNGKSHADRVSRQMDELYRHTTTLLQQYSYS
ncbi:hypothetical protein [Spirosoma fluviale]|uniref:1-acyl-sn-glycerol-3-phosphate acyltransferase n=1 Tax=Spirosoma fluviale TaxID=1597977 RepID=A0A286GWD9_9BACT|nr:hypothetical protein [Spirosoma fluviale]SOD99813.1 hypothetical protein SAMN06269250_0181 [Spirosoma fluviale]